MRWVHLLLVWAVPVLCTSACAKDDPDGPEPPVPMLTFEQACADVPGCETPAMAVPGPREAIWRVLVIRDPSGVVSIRAVQEVDVAAAIGRPQGPIHGSHGLAALDASGTALEVQLLRFPDTLYLEGLDPFEPRVEQDLSASAVDTVGYLQVSDAVANLAVVDSTGVIVHMQAAPAPGEAVMPPAEVGSSSEPLVQASAASACAHVVLLEGDVDAMWYPPGIAEDYRLLPIVTPTQRAVVRAALGMMPPMLCAGLSRIAFVDMGADGAGTAGQVDGHLGDLMLLNAMAPWDGGLLFSETGLQQDVRRAKLIHTVIHEAAHTAEFLMREQADESWVGGVWSPTQRTLADETIDRVRLRGGLAAEWGRLHGSFFGLGWAESYLIFPLDGLQRDAIRELDAAGLAAWGFMSQYATLQRHEDLAETVTWPIVGPLMRDMGIAEGAPPYLNDSGCQAMRAHTSQDIPQSLSVVYAKLAFVRDLGLITDEAFDTCTGPNIGLPITQEGITVFEDGVVQRTFTTDPTAVIGTLGDHYVFEFTVAGMAEFGDMTYPATLRLELDQGPLMNGAQPRPVEQVSWPRGLYSLSPLHDNHFQLRMEDAAAGNFNVTDGFVLVTEASNDRLVGSVYAELAWRPDAPIPVPQTFDPPLQFRFLLEN